MKVTELLGEWPDHPLLLQISLLSNRLLSFSSATPLMRLMVGAELLSEKVTEWNKYAHKGVAMTEEGRQLGTLCGRWRKEELRGWSELSSTRLGEWNMRVGSDWWVRMYQLLVLKGDDDENGNAEGAAENEDGKRTASLGTKQEVADWDDEELTWLLNLLKDFIESGKVGDFPARHSLLSSFSAHIFSRAALGDYSEKTRYIWPLSGSY